MREFFTHPLVWPLFVLTVLGVVIWIATMAQAIRDGVFDPTKAPLWLRDYVVFELSPLLGLAFLTWAVGFSSGNPEVDPITLGFGALYSGTYLAVLRKYGTKLNDLYRGQPDLDQPIDDPVSG